MNFLYLDCNVNSEVVSKDLCILRTIGIKHINVSDIDLKHSWLQHNFLGTASSILASDESSNRFLFFFTSALS